MGQYMDPDAAAHAESEYAHAVYLMGQTLARVSNANVCGLAASLAYTYIAGDATEALEYYRSQRFSADVRDEAIVALACQSLYGNNGSDAWMAYSLATRWAPEADGPQSEREVSETMRADINLRTTAANAGVTLTEAHKAIVARHIAHPGPDSVRWIRAFDRALVIALASRDCAHAVSDEVGMTTSCDHGCKVYECRVCGARFDVHYALYGCTQF